MPRALCPQLLIDVPQCHLKTISDLHGSKVALKPSTPTPRGHHLISAEAVEESLKVTMIASRRTRARASYFSTTTHSYKLWKNQTNSWWLKQWSVRSKSAWLAKSSQQWDSYHFWWASSLLIWSTSHWKRTTTTEAKSGVSNRRVSYSLSTIKRIGKGSSMKPL